VLHKWQDGKSKIWYYNSTLKWSAQVQYNYNTIAIQEFFSCTAVVLHLCRPLQYNAAIQVFYNLQKTCRLLAAVVKKLCIAVVLHLCGPLNNKKKLPPPLVEVINDNIVTHPLYLFYTCCSRSHSQWSQSRQMDTQCRGQLSPSVEHSAPEHRSVVSKIKFKTKLDSTGYSAWPSPPRLMQCACSRSSADSHACAVAAGHCGVQSRLGGQTHRHTDAKHHNTFSVH